MISEVINDIIMYMEYLKEQGYYVTIHFQTDKFSSLMYAFSKYNIHRNPYCNLIKSEPDAWKHCIARQKKIYLRLKQGCFWGMCYAGVEEYIFPLKNQEVFGFISVGGYAIDRIKAQQRIKAVAQKYELDAQRLQKAYQKLRSKKPDFYRINTVIKPLCHMFSLAYGMLPNASNSDGSMQTMISKMIEFINRHYAEKITLSDLCRLCNVSGSTISHNFKKMTGYHVREYITLVRMTNAKLLLVNTDLSIGEISGLVGYEDSNYFTNSFRNSVGISPKKFRNTSIV